ncbi:Hypothetical protein (plasmid) [Pseudomonas putida]|jgi:hypothetical protein|uniref:hypothetical protein n=1 Tax=Pseudomonas sp. TaxID=306 RepID=UPI0014495BB9|nr:hypothetical protein [Pseudomonas sp.]QDQ70733.1 hypothetical protein pJBCL41_00230 [Pseudomonas sp.]QIZ22895.1 Hypothetical protein [Pseudomonas putida]
MNHIKNTLAQLDNGLLVELLEAAQFALNDTRTVKRVARAGPGWTRPALNLALQRAGRRRKLEP